jgi:WD40 repeat protein
VGHVHVASIAMSHDGSTVAGGLSQHATSSGDVGPEYGIKVWDAATGKLRFTIRGHEGGVGAVTFSPDDRWIVSASYDGTIRYWDSASGRWFASLMMARDGRWEWLTESGLVAGTSDGENVFNVVRGLKPAPLSRFQNELYRPELVEALLNGDHERRYRTAAQQLNLEKIWESRSAP